jgi:DNA-binding XRE family transcriptional regulator
MKEIKMKRKKETRASVAGKRDHGYTVTTVQEFLGLTDEDMALIELKIDLIKLLKKTRVAKGLTQLALARSVGSSQSRIAKMEGGSADVSLDLLCKALFALGASTGDLAKAISTRNAA